MAKIISSIQSNPYISDSDVSDVELQEDYLTSAPSNNYKEYQTSKHFHSNLNGSDLKNKKIWLIKAPKDLDISKIKTIPLVGSQGSSSSSTAAQLLDIKTSSKSQQQDRKYYIGKDALANKKSLKIMTLKGKNDKFLKINKNLEIDQILNITSRVEIPEIQLEKVNTPRHNVVKVEGLKMEHFATGYDSSDFPEAQSSASAKETKDSDESSSRKEKKPKKEKKEKKDKKSKKNK